MSKKLKLSPWHDGSVKPVHVGLYHRDLAGDGSLWYNFWNGNYWMDGALSKREAMRNKAKSAFQNEAWRGVLK